MNKAMSGVVLRRSGDKSVTAAVERLVKHPVVGKHVKKRTKIMCHDEANECIAGDRVTIEPCRKLSKRKSFRIVEIVKPNPIIGKGRRVALREEAHPNPAFRGAASRVRRPPRPTRPTWPRRPRPSTTTVCARSSTWRR